MMSQTYHIFEKFMTKTMMAQHRFFVLAGKRTKIKCLLSQNVTISVLFRRNSCFSIDKIAQTLSNVRLIPVLSQFANADQVMRVIGKKKTVGKVSHNVRSHLCPEVGEIFQTPSTRENIPFSFFTLRCVSWVK